MNQWLYHRPRIFLAYTVFSPIPGHVLMIYISVVVAYVVLLLGISIHKSRSVESADDFMVAGRSVPV
jgi:hypothetical protein